MLHCELTLSCLPTCRPHLPVTLLIVVAILHKAGLLYLLNRENHSCLECRGHVLHWHSQQCCSIQFCSLDLRVLLLPLQWLPDLLQPHSCTPAKVSTNGQTTSQNSMVEGRRHGKMANRMPRQMHQTRIQTALRRNACKLQQYENGFSPQIQTRKQTQSLCS